MPWSIKEGDDAEKYILRDTRQGVEFCAFILQNLNKQLQRFQYRHQITTKNTEGRYSEIEDYLGPLHDQLYSNLWRFWKDQSSDEYEVILTVRRHLKDAQDELLRIMKKEVIISKGEKIFDPSHHVGNLRDHIESAAEQMEDFIL